MDYLLYIATMIAIYSILSVSLNLVMGYGGMLSIAHAALYGTGAYVAALMALKLNAPVWVAIPCATIIGGLIGALVAIPFLRTSDDHFAIITLAFQLIAFGVFNNWRSLTGGPLGLADIPQPTVFGWHVSSDSAFFLLTCALCAVILVISYHITHSPFGRSLKAIREDEVFTAALGKNVVLYKITIFAVASAMASVAGALYAYYVSFIDPTSFTMLESVFIVSIVIIGGAGTFWGPVIGAVALVSLPELLRFFGMPDSCIANVRQILYGMLLIALLIWRPEGLIGNSLSQKDDHSK